MVWWWYVCGERLRKEWGYVGKGLEVVFFFGRGAS